MADDYLSDREQEEALRQWWRENWSWIIGGIVLGLAALGGWRYWEVRSAESATQAAALYGEMQSALEIENTERAVQILDELASEHASSAYTQQGRLLLARAYVGSEETDEALALLQKVVESAEDEELARIARLRAARLQIQLGRYDEALKLEPEEAGAFSAQVHEIRGDALVAKGDLESARAEYAAALGGNDAAIDRTQLEMKLQDVGGEPGGAE